MSLFRSGRIGETIAVLLFFAAIAFFQLSPLSLHPGDSVHDPGDPLLNSWILSWVGDQLVRDPLHLFEANAFYPHHLALAFSEHMLPLAAAAAPFYFLSKNPILAHNIILFLTFILNAAGMYALVKHLTRNRWAGVVSGLIFTFSSYKIMHVSHLQLLASMGIPWAFLYLHKFLTERTWRSALLFSFFFTLQALSCIYYGLFFIAVLVLVLPVFVLLGGRELKLSFFLKLAASFAVGGGILLLFSLPYARVFQTMGLRRALPAGAEVQNYLAAVPPNLLFGRLLYRLGTHEKFLFPGLSAILLAIAAVVETRKSGLSPGRTRTRIVFAKIVRIGVIIFVVLNLSSILVALTGGASIRLGPIRITTNRPEKPVLYFFLLCGLSLLVKLLSHLRSRKDGVSPRSDPILADAGTWVLGYSILAFWAAALSFGAAFTFMGRSTSLVPMPFSFFYRLVQGFNGIREPSRFAVFVLFGVGVLAGFGLDRITRATKKDWLKTAAAVGLIAFISVESLSIPIERVAVPVGRDIPPTYSWLGAQPPGAVVLELPFSEWLPGESLYMYFSTFHKKKLINGYSGFVPASTYVLRDVFREFPSAECFDLMALLKADFVVFHAKLIPEAFVPAVGAHVVAASGGALRLVERFRYGFSRPNAYQSFLGDDLVFAARFENSGRSPELQPEPTPPAPIPPAGLRIAVERNPAMAGLMSDHDLSTGWTSGRARRTGEFIRIDLGEPRDIAEVSLQSGAFHYDFGRNFRIEFSDDGSRWRAVPSRYLRTEFCLALIEDQVHAAQRILIDGGPTRYLKVIQVGDDEVFPWSVAELKIFERSKSGS